MEQIISKEEIDKFKNIKGEIRGMGMRTYVDFVLKREGKSGVEKLEEVVKEFDYPVKLQKIKILGFYPLGLLGVLLVSIKRLFKYSDKEFQEMGEFHVKSSLLIRVFAKYFFSLEKVLSEIPRMWKEHLTVGRMKVVKYDKEKKEIVIRLEEYYFHPLHCEILKGFFLGAFQMALKTRGICEETKCIYKGDEYHEFLLKW